MNLVGEARHGQKGIMARCCNTTDLGVYHVRTDGGNGVDNARVLCADCRDKTSTYGAAAILPPPFTPETIQKALKRANRRCECTVDASLQV